MIFVAIKTKTDLIYSQKLDELFIIQRTWCDWIANIFGKDIYGDTITSRRFLTKFKPFVLIDSWEE